MKYGNKIFPVISRAAIAAAASIALSAAASARTDLSTLVPNDVLESAGSQTPEGRRPMQNYLFGDGPAPQAIAARAAVAIRGLASSGLFSDPASLLAAANNIAAVAQPALCPPRVMRAFVPNNFSLPSGVAGFDFGPAGAQTMPGFDPVRPNDNRLVGSNPRGLHRPGENRLLSDGILGIRRFTTPMENGVHRIFLMTDDIGDEETQLSPLGGRIIVNGRAIELGDHPSADWLPEAVLQDPRLPTEVTDKDVSGTPIDSQRGGALMVEVEIFNGQLEIEMRQPEGTRGRSSYLVGLIAAPIAQGDVIGRYFNASEAVLDTDQCLALEGEINEAIAELVDEITQAAILQKLPLVPAAVFADGASASPG